MKKFFSFLSICVALFAASSCKHAPSSATFYLAANFEFNETEYYKYFEDSLLYAPKYYFAQPVAYLTSMSADINSGYIGGSKISLKKGSPTDFGEIDYFTSAGPNAGAAGSGGYIAYRNTGFVPDYDLVYDLSSYTSALNTVVGCYINNTEHTQRQIAAAGVPTGDYLKVVLTFYLNNKMMGSAEKYLVDNSHGELKVVEDWVVWNIADDLTKTGTEFSFDAVKFSVETPGIYLEPSFCLDGFTSQMDVEY